jgi:hypothetical protein
MPGTLGPCRRSEFATCDKFFSGCKFFSECESLVGASGSQSSGGESSLGASLQGVRVFSGASSVGASL